MWTRSSFILTGDLVVYLIVNLQGERWLFWHYRSLAPDASRKGQYSDLQVGVYHPFIHQAWMTTVVMYYEDCNVRDCKIQHTAL
jgi:hypothetical protein